MIILCIFDIDSKVFFSKFKKMEDIMNHIFESKKGNAIEKLWIYRFIEQHKKLKMYFNYIYDFQKAFYKDFKFFEKWFRLIANM